MPRCYRNGYVIDATIPLPVFPSEHDVWYLPTIGCSRLRCKRCGALVRNAPGLAFATKQDLDARSIAAIYELSDILKSPLIHRTQSRWRLYLCRCDRWLATHESLLDPPDPDDSPGKPWQCDDHPSITLPDAIGEVRLAGQQDLVDLTRRGLHGHVPPGVRESDRPAAFWLLRIYSQLQPDIAAAMIDVAASTIEDNDPQTRFRSLRLLYVAATTAMREALFESLVSKPELYRVEIEVPARWMDDNLEDAAWCILASLLANEGRARDYARSEALRGRAKPVMYDALAAHDSEWLLSHVEEIARAAPGLASELIGSFNVLPAQKRSRAHAERVRRALIRDGELLDALRRAALELAKTTRRDVPVNGDITPVRRALPQLLDGIKLELVVSAPPNAVRERHLNLRVKLPNGKWATRTLIRGARRELISFLDSEDIADRIVYESLEARRYDLRPCVPTRPPAGLPVDRVPLAQPPLLHERDARGTPMSLDQMLAQPGPLLPAWDLRSTDARRLSVYRVGPNGAALVGSTGVAAEDREATNEKVRDRGLRVGNSYESHVWVIDDAGFTVWSTTAQLIDGTREEVRVSDQLVRTKDITRVETFTAPDDVGHRGVYFVVGSRKLVVAEERDTTPENDPTYDAMELDLQIMWAVFLGRDLALWLRLPYADRRGEVTNAAQLMIYDATCALADKVAGVPERGEFEFVFQPVGSIDGSGEVVLRLAANPLEDELRFVEQRVHTASGKSWAGRWIKQGTNAQIAAFLRNVRTPETIMRTTRDLRRKLVEDGCG